MDASWILRAPPPRLAPGQLLVIAAVGLVGATLGLELVHSIAGSVANPFLETPGERLWVAASTGFFSAGLAAVATRAQTLGGAAALCLVALPASVANTIVCLMGVLSLKEGPSLGAAMSAFVFGGLYGVVFGGPCGVVLGLGYAWPILSFVRARRDASLDAFDRVLSWTGGWALLMGAGAAGLGLARGASDGGMLADEALLGLGALTLAIGVTRRGLRARWLRAVRRGRVEGFDVVPREAMTRNADGALPFVGDHTETCDALLVQVSAHADSAYRGAQSRTVCALVRQS
jgi:hypothetical protein